MSEKSASENFIILPKRTEPRHMSGLFHAIIVLMKKALYRKYRPKCLSEVVGQPQVTDILKKALSSDNFSHAYLFIGPRGCGKTSVARIFAHEVNKFNYELEDDYVDIIEIDAASNTGVDNIRELREKANIAPTSGKYKVYIIDEVHMLSKSAFNALLKTLEEPPKHVIFIMATTDAEKVPVTITSRSQVFTFQLADQEIMFNHLKTIAESEKIDIDDNALRIIVKRGGGSFRDTLSLLDQIMNFSDEKITKELIESILGLPQEEMLVDLLEKYSSGDIISITKSLKQLLNTGLKATTLTEELINLIIENPNPAYLSLLSKLIEVKSPFEDAKLLVALTQNLQAAPMAKIVSEPKPEKPAPTPVNPIIEARSEMPKKVEEKAPEKAPEPIFSTTLIPPENFDWNTFCETIEKNDSGLAAQIKKLDHELKDSVLHIYTTSGTTLRILTARKQILTEYAGLRVEIHKSDKNSANNAAQFQKISDIMGSVEEVNKNGGEIPF